MKDETLLPPYQSHVQINNFVVVVGGGGGGVVVLCPTMQKGRLLKYVYIDIYSCILILTNEQQQQKIDVCVCVLVFCIILSLISFGGFSKQKFPLLFSGLLFFVIFNGNIYAMCV